jgi:putative endonuclease
MTRGGTVYITASKHWTLYTGVSSDLVDRIWKHKTKAFPGFSAKYNCDRLVYVESFDSIEEAIAREKQIKGWRREKKLNLIRANNPTLEDLAADWFPQDGIDRMKAENQDRHRST